MEPAGIAMGGPNRLVVEADGSWSVRETPAWVSGEGRAVKLSGRALRLSIFIGEGDIWHHKPLYTEIVRRAHKAGLAGATVIRGIEGYGASSRIHTTHLFRLSSDLPLVVVIVDAEDRVREFLPQLDELEISGLVILDEVNVVRYVADERKRRGLRRAR